MKINIYNNNITILSTLVLIKKYCLSGSIYSHHHIINSPTPQKNMKTLKYLTRNKQQIQNAFCLLLWHPIAPKKR